MRQAVGSAGQLITRRPWLIWGGLAALVVIGFSRAAANLAGVGFPLDDAWIHQSYARSLALRAEWSIVPGEVSGGSTAPLWSVMLALGHLFRLAPTIWSGLLGIVLLLALAIAVGRALADQGLSPAWVVGAGALLLLEWHLVWAAASGMETLAAALLAFELNRRLLREAPNPLLIGGLIGVGVWLRPDLLTLAGPALMVWLIRWRRGQFAVGWLGRLLLSMAGLVVPYLLLQLRLSGEIWPSTLYAKQAEYASLVARPYPARLLEQVQPLLAGPLALLVPSLFLWLADRLRRRQWLQLAPLLWAVGYMGMFAARLPVNYQHGRYAMPTLPLLLWLGLTGLNQLWRAARGRWQWVMTRAWLAAVGAVTIAFLSLGARAFATDVAIIETEMVRTSRWIADNTEPDSLVAAHDIGALGYFGQRRILDLAGLISPDVIPILRDQAALAARLDQAGADYLMSFPGWYPQLTSEATLIFQTTGQFSRAAGGENMAVYRP